MAVRPPRTGYAPAGVTYEHGGGGPSTRYYTKRGQVPAGHQLRFRKGRGYYAGPKPKPATATGPAADASADPFATIVNQMLAAQYAPLDQAEKQRIAQQQAEEQNLASVTSSLVQALRGQVAPAATMWDQAIGQQDQFAKNAAAQLSAASPNADLQKQLQQIGAPAAQQADVAAQNQALFGGQAASLYTSEGAIPGAGLVSQKAANLSQLMGLPTQYALAGQQSLGGLLSRGAQASADYRNARAQVAGQYPALYQQLASSAADQQAKQQQLMLEAQTLGLTNRKDLAALSGVDPVTGAPTLSGRSTIAGITGVDPATGLPTYGAANAAANRAARAAAAAAKTKAKAAAAQTSARKNRGGAVATYKRQVLGVPTAVNKKVTTGTGLLQTTTTVKTRRQYQAILQQAMGLPEVQILTDRFNLTPDEVRAIAVAALASKGIRPRTRKRGKTSSVPGYLGY